MQDPGSAFVTMFVDAGITLAAPAGERQVGGDVVISEERIGDLAPADALVTVDYGGLTERMATSELYALLPAVAAGRVLTLTGEEFQPAQGGLLAGPWFLDEVLPRLVEILS